MSFCGYAILNRETMVVPDATKDKRFQGNPLVAGEPHIRFYAGVPLRTKEGLNVGSLCVIDREPRELTEKQEAALRVLAKQVIAHMQMRQHANQLESLVKNLTKKEEEIAQYQTKLEAANAALQNLSLTDDLTQLKNRRAFRERLEGDYRLAMRHQLPLSLALIDVDRFKHYNDTHGHPAGDAVLREVARIIERTARSTDCVARYGGEEFIVLLPNTAEGGARTIGEKIRKAVEEMHGHEEALTISVGVSTLQSSGQTLPQLLESTDQALYQAKLNGRNRVVHFHDMKAPLRVGAAALREQEQLHPRLL
jgi:diguanylate cyclase (GGDEF)-like protein